MAYGLIFDVDGVIADTEALSCRACSDAFYQLHGIVVPEEDHLAFKGATARKHAEGIARMYGVSINAIELVSAHEANFLEALQAAEGIEFPGVCDLIARVGRYPEWRLALATSSTRASSEATIESTPIDTSLLSSWVTGDDIERSKPDPEIYIRTASHLGLFPTQCVVIEDSVVGIEAAKGASMRCVAVTNTFPGEELRNADRIVDTLEAVDVTMLYDLVLEGR